MKRKNGGRWVNFLSWNKTLLKKQISTSVAYVIVKRPIYFNLCRRPIYFNPHRRPIYFSLRLGYDSNLTESDISETAQEKNSREGWGHHFETNKFENIV